MNWHRSGCLFSFTNVDGTLGEGFLSMCMDGVMETYSLRRSSKSDARSAPVKIDSLGCENALAMAVNPFTHSEILVVMNAEWRLYKLDTLALLLSVPCSSVLGWAGGTFFKHSEVLMWAKDGTATLFRFPEELRLASEGKFMPKRLAASVTASLADQTTIPNAGSPTTVATFVVHSSGSDVGLSKTGTVGSAVKGTLPSFVFWRPPRAEQERSRLVCADATGAVVLWDLAGVSGVAGASNQLQSELVTAEVSAAKASNVGASSDAARIGDGDGGAGTQGSSRAAAADVQQPTAAWAGLTPADGPAEVLPSCRASLSENWAAEPFVRRLTDGQVDSDLMCSIIVGTESQKKLVVGLNNGQIVASPVAHVIGSLLKTPALDNGAGEATFVKMSGHTERVTCMLSPYNHGCAVDPAVFVSGSLDYTVRAWNYQTGELLHTFMHHCGEVSQLFCPPSSSPLLRRGCFCSVAMDHSVGIFSLENFSCLYLIGGHCFPIRDVRWRSADDLLIIGCSDGTVSVWQLTTGHLDRSATGQVAIDILESCDEDASSDAAAQGLQDQGIKISTVAFGPGDPRALLLSFELERMAVTLSRNATWRRPSSPQGKVEEPPDSDEMKLAKQFLSCILCWQEGHGERLDATLRSELGLVELGATVSFGVCGVKGRNSFLVPLRNSTQLRWRQSSTATTTHLLTITALAHCFHRLEVDRSKQAMWLHLISWYTTTWGAECIAGYVPPKLLPLAAIWEHWQYDIQRVARAHLQARVHDLDEKGRSMLIHHGIARLPTSAKEHSEDKIAAVILLGVLAFVHKKALDRDTAKVVASTLMEIVKSETAGIKHRAAAAEVLSRAYSIFQPFCDLSSVFVILTELAGKTSLSRGNQLDAVTTQALINFASTNPQLFVSTVNNQIFLPSFKGQSSVLKVLKALVKKQPMVLKSELPKVVDVVVRCFDPNLPKIREACFKSAMSVVHEMCPAYPMMSLFRPSARLAVGGSDGLINIYDLKSATRWQAIPAHSSPITALAFAHDGKTLASFSLFEKIIRVWHVTGSFFSMLGSGPRCTNSFPVPGGIDDLTDAEVLHLLTLVWTDRKVLRLVARNKLDLKFTV